LSRLAGPAMYSTLYGHPATPGSTAPSLAPGRCGATCLYTGQRGTHTTRVRERRLASRAHRNARCCRQEVTRQRAWASTRTRAHSRAQHHPTEVEGPKIGAEGNVAHLLRERNKVLFRRWDGEARETCKVEPPLQYAELAVLVELRLARREQPQNRVAGCYSSGLRISLGAARQRNRALRWHWQVRLRPRAPDQPRARS
jgi:hypothetical protein